MSGWWDKHEQDLTAVDIREMREDAMRYRQLVDPKGGLEQARRNLKALRPELYAYIEARVAARELERAAGDAGGANNQYGAANRLYNAAAREERRWRAMLK